MKDDKGLFQSDNQILLLGNGGLGGKAKGLQFIDGFIKKNFRKEDFADFDVNIPKMVVLTTDVFDEFMETNDLYDIAYSNLPDNRIALAFQRANLPFFILGDLRKIATISKTPLAIRSSSNLEDAKFEPFAGVYGTKMTPNNQLDIDERYNKLIEAIKYVYATTFFKAAKNYLAATSNKMENEKMAIIIQEVVGDKIGNNYYPHISGVARSYNFYPVLGANPEDGIVSLAMGLGKTIVDGGVSWSYVPSLPRRNPPFKSIGHMLKESQIKYWSVNMANNSEYDPINETEFLKQNFFIEVEDQTILSKLVSSYNPKSDQIYPGLVKGGALILSFAPVLYASDIKLNDLIIKLLWLAKKAYNSAVEIEFAVTLSKDVSIRPHRFGFLQVRPMVVSSEVIQVEDYEIRSKDVLVASEMVLGNGVIDDIYDIVYVKKESFSSENTHTIAKEIDRVNSYLLAEGRKCVLIGFGRWGTTDATGGIPVNWNNISSAKVIVEMGLASMNFEMSQGSHFFHNVTSFKVHYFSIPYESSFDVDWDWLEGCNVVKETSFIKHITTDSPLIIKTNGRKSKGVILKPDSNY